MNRVIANMFLCDMVYQIVIIRGIDWMKKGLPRNFIISEQAKQISCFYGTKWFTAIFTRNPTQGLQLELGE
jgi:hypothetical protein